MKFQRIVLRQLPNGEFVYVFPFHICTKGQEDKVLFRNEEDLRVAYNYLVICSLEANVLIFVSCVLNTHIHCGILASSHEDAQKFLTLYKITISKYLRNKYGAANILKDVEGSAIPVEDDFHLRNVICYTLRNSLDAGIPVDKYKWSSFSALFHIDDGNRPTVKISDLGVRKIRNLLLTRKDLTHTGWKIFEDGLLDPSSFTDHRYCEDAFYCDLGFFYKVLGLTDDARMEQIMVNDPLDRHSVDEIIRVIEDNCQKRYSKSLSQLTMEQKVPVVRTVYHSFRTTPSQLARCFGITKAQVLFIIGKKPGSGAV